MVAVNGMQGEQPTVPDTVSDSVSPGARSRGIDYAALWQQVDAESARVVVIDLERRAIAAGRAMGNFGDSNARMPADASLERLFPGAVAQVERWCAELDSDSGELVAQGLSPRQWTYFWRLNPKAALLAVVHHRFGRGAVAAGDTATIRLLCEHWLAPELQAMGIGRAAQTTWNRVDRRARAAAPRELWGALGAIGLATACGLWLAVGSATPAMPAKPTAGAASSEIQRLTKLSDETLARSLALAMAERDYGEAQEALADHLTMGHFAAAVVLNERKQVVAHVGLTSPPTVGQPLPAPLPGSRQFNLRWAGASIGELVTVAGSPPEAAAAVDSSRPAAPTTRIVGGLLVLAGLISGVALWRHLRARYR
jgi:hypothetical protein